jgi:hypothetical protein
LEIQLQYVCCIVAYVFEDAWGEHADVQHECCGQYNSARGCVYTAHKSIEEIDHPIKQIERPLHKVNETVLPGHPDYEEIVKRVYSVPEMKSFTIFYIKKIHLQGFLQLNNGVILFSSDKAYGHVNPKEVMKRTKVQHRSVIYNTV